jgi:hypothetical protein
MPKNGAIPIRCELGGIAMIVKSKFAMNRGIIVKIIEPMGFMRWPGFGKSVIPVWRVQVLCSQSTICYHLAKKGKLRREVIGLVPDRFLRSLTPLTGQMHFCFEYYELDPDVEPMVL